MTQYKPFLSVPVPVCSQTWDEAGTFPKYLVRQCQYLPGHCERKTVGAWLHNTSVKNLLFLHSLFFAHTFPKKIVAAHNWGKEIPNPCSSKTVSVFHSYTDMKHGTSTCSLLTYIAVTSVTSIRFNWIGKTILLKNLMPVLSHFTYWTTTVPLNCILQFSFGFFLVYFLFLYLVLFGCFGWFCMFTGVFGVLLGCLEWLVWPISIFRSSYLSKLHKYR